MVCPASLRRSGALPFFRGEVRTKRSVDPESRRHLYGRITSETSLPWLPRWRGRETSVDMLLGLIRVRVLDGRRLPAYLVRFPPRGGRPLRRVRGLICVRRPRTRGPEVRRAWDRRRRLRGKDRTEAVTVRRPIRFGETGVAGKASLLRPSTGGLRCAASIKYLTASGIMFPRIVTTRRNGNASTHPHAELFFIRRRSFSR